MFEGFVRWRAIPENGEKFRRRVYDEQILEREKDFVQQGAYAGQKHGLSIKEFWISKYLYLIVLSKFQNKCKIM